jgi:primosomal protein N' (replication factor Y)
MFAEVVFNLPALGAFTYAIPEPGLGDTESRCVPGVRVIAPFGSRTLTGYVLSTAAERSETGFAVKPIERVLDREPLFSDEHVELARWMEGMYLCSLGEALAAMIPSGKRESELPLFPDEVEDYVPHDLSDEQKAAVEETVTGSATHYYLYGMTGSGKTEVYLSAAERILASGKGVIYLVPEISLTHQLIRHLQARFGARVAVLHSHLTPSQRLLPWMRILRREADLVVGARSAVFAPVAKLGLIVIDEEHESSYKSGSTPRYHARQVAMKRCAISGARLLMGSATPSVEAYHLMTQGTLRRLDLRRRLSGGKPPEIDIVDMKRESGTISRLLAERIRAVKAEGKQSILFSTGAASPTSSIAGAAALK